MKKLVVFSVVTLLGAALAGPAVLGGAKNDGKVVTLDGSLACAKCKLQKPGQEGCQNVLIVEQNGKTKHFYLTRNDVYKKFGDVCMATPRVRITGTIVKKDDARWLTATEILPHGEEG